MPHTPHTPHTPGSAHTPGGGGATPGSSHTQGPPSVGHHSLTDVDIPADLNFDPAAVIDGEGTDNLNVSSITTSSYTFLSININTCTRSPCVAIIIVETSTRSK